MEPLVSIIIPVYNAEKFIVECLKSVQSQCYKNLEIVIINDGSTDGTNAILCSTVKNDPRITYISRENLGLVATLNQLISLSKGKYIARMDADDIASPDRITRQVEYFLANPDVGIVGSRTELINEAGISLGFCKRPISSTDVKAYFLYGSPLAHPSVMFNLHVIAKNELTYDKSSYPVEDLELWLRLARKYKIANIKSPLLKYRVNSTGISQTNKQHQVSKSSELRIDVFSEFPRLVRLVKSIDDSSGSLPVRTIKRFIYSFAAALGKSPFGLADLLKVWVRTFIRDLRTLR